MSVFSIFSGFGAIYVLAYLFEKIISRRVFDDPVKGKVASVAAGWFVVGALIAALQPPGFGYLGFMTTLFAAVVLGFFAYQRGLTVREMNETEAASNIADTFE